MFCQQMMAATMADMPTEEGAKAHRLVVLFHWLLCIRTICGKVLAIWTNLLPSAAHSGNALTNRPRIAFPKESQIPSHRPSGAHHKCIREENNLK